MSQITAPFDAIAAATNVLNAAVAQIDTDETALATAQAAVTNAQGTLTAAEAALNTDMTAGQTAADSLVAAIANAGFTINVPSPSNPTPPAPTGN